MNGNQGRSGVDLQFMIARSLVAVFLAVASLSACGDDGGPETLRSYDVQLEVDDSQDRYRFVPVDEVPDFTVGDEVTFVVNNTGSLQHDLQIVAPDGDVLGSAPAVAPGDTLEVTVFLGQVGVYQLNCLIDNHLTEHNMQNLIEVGPAEV